MPFTLLINSQQLSVHINNENFMKSNDSVWHKIASTEMMDATYMPIVAGL